MVGVSSDRIGAVFGELCRTSARAYRGSTMVVMSAVEPGYSLLESSVVFLWRKDVGAGAVGAGCSGSSGILGEFGTLDMGGEESGEETAVCALFFFFFFFVRC